MKIVPNENWDGYSYRSNGGRVVVSFHTDADKIPKESLPLCARVIIPINEPNENGGPQQPEAETLWAMEDELVADLEKEGVSCLLLGRLTHAGDRELVFQVQDWKSFRPPVGRWMERHRDRAIDVSEHDGWDFFFSSVWPSEEDWMFIHDRRVVDNLRKSGSDPSKDHTLEFVFYGEEQALRSMKDELCARGYTVCDLNPQERRLVISQPMSLDVNAIFQESLSHTERAKDLGLEYDGWGCTVVK